MNYTREGAARPYSALSEITVSAVPVHNRQYGRISPTRMQAFARCDDTQSADRHWTLPLRDASPRRTPLRAGRCGELLPASRPNLTRTLLQAEPQHCAEEGFPTAHAHATRIGRTLRDVTAEEDYGYFCLRDAVPQFRHSNNQGYLWIQVCAGHADHAGKVIRS
jgi:hypothetical protein